MTAQTEKKKSGNLITPLAILSYPYLFTPQPPQNDGEKAKYGCTLVFTPEAQKDKRYAALKAEAIAVARRKWGAEADDLIRAGKLKMPFLSDDSAGYPEGSTFIRPRSEQRPGVVGTTLDPMTGKLAFIDDPAAIYAGVRGHASVSCYAYEKKMNRGVTFGLCNFQKVADGERLDGRRAATDEFEPIESTTDDDLAGLIG